MIHESSQLLIRPNETAHKTHKLIKYTTAWCRFRTFISNREKPLLKAALGFRKGRWSFNFQSAGLMEEESLKKISFLIWKTTRIHDVEEKIGKSAFDCYRILLMRQPTRYDPQPARFSPSTKLLPWAFRGDSNERKEEKKDSCECLEAKEEGKLWKINKSFNYGGSLMCWRMSHLIRN